MSVSLQQDHFGSPSVQNSLLVFLFFLAGALFHTLGLLPVPVFSSPRLFFLLLLASMLLFSTSSFGWLLLPLCLFLFGIVCENSAIQWFQQLPSKSALVFLPVSRDLILFSTFLVVGDCGFKTASHLQILLHRSSPSVRSAYDKYLFRLFVLSLICLALILCFY